MIPYIAAPSAVPIDTSQIEYAKAWEHYEDTISNKLSIPKIKFQLLKNEWKSETSHLSSIESIVINTAYQTIISMGKDAVPFILEEMKVRPDHWFWALKVITGENPVKPEYKGKISKMTECWLDWGKENGYIK